MQPRKQVLFRPNDLHPSYLDPSERVWEYYDATGDEYPLECEVCNCTNYQGFICMDGGNEICDNCAEFVPPWLGYELRDEATETLESRNRFVLTRSLIGAALIESFRAEMAPRKYLGWVRPC